MARRLILTAAGVAAALLALVGYAAVVRKYAHGGPGVRPPEPSQVGARASFASAQLANAEIRLRALRQRVAMEDSLRARAVGDTSTLVIAVEAEGWRGREGAAALKQVLREEWATLGLSVTKVAVAVVVIDRQTARRWGYFLSLRGDEATAFYILPDSLTPATCLAVVAAPFVPADGKTPDVRSLRRMAGPWLGPCAFYARFGIPGPRVRAWLTDREFDLALDPDWTVHEADTLPLFPGLSPRGESKGWYWDMIYWMPPQAVGCLSGRAAACRATLRERSPAPGSTRDRWIFSQSSNSWRFTRQQLTGGDRFLGAVARQAGDRRFEDLWHTTLPVDSALTIALRRPVGEWTAEWERTVAEPPRFGPAPRVWDALVVLLLILGAAGIVARNARLREVG